MQDWQQRVVGEEAELSMKIEKLDAFIKTASYSKLHPDDRVLLDTQLKYMSAYRAVLVARIKRFELPADVGRVEDVLK